MNDKFSKNEKSKINEILKLIDSNYNYKDLNSKRLENNLKEFDKKIKEEKEKNE